MKKILKVLVLVIVVILIFGIYLVFPIPNSSGLEVEFSECDEKLKYSLEEFDIYMGDNVLVSTNWIDFKTFELNAIIWTNCATSPKVATYQIKDSMINLNNSIYSNNLQIISDSGLATSCSCPHITKYIINDLEQQEYIVNIDGQEVKVENKLSSLISN